MDKLLTYHFINDTIKQYIAFKLSKKYQKQLIQVVCLYCANNSNTQKDVFLYDTFLFNINLEKYHLNTTTKEDIFECGNIKGYVNMLVENIEEAYYNYDFTKGKF